MTHPYLILSMAVCVLCLAFILSESDPEPESLLVLEEVNKEVPELAEPAEDDAIYSEPIELTLEILEETPPAPAVNLASSEDWKFESVRKGDNLSKIFQRIGLSPQQVYQVISLDDNTKALKRINPGELIGYQIDSEKQLQALKYTIDIQNTLYIERLDGQLASRIENKTIEYRTAYAYGTIKDSLFTAGKEAGLSDSQVMQLANIFAWDIDFILDIRSGDSFSMLYQEKYLEGEKIGNGEILAAEFVNQGKPYAAVHYTDSKDNSSYYTPEGLSMRKAFLRAPLNFAYISSSFKPKRFHPILKRWKAHRGIDYRAKTGTPIKAAGDGRVTASGYNKYNGKYVFIQHGQGIVTKYLHMSRRAVSRNKKVKQGQVIGYVGATGLAEAPHLHYEFVVNGVHRNPRTVKLPQAKPIAAKEKSRFEKDTAVWLTQLNNRNALRTSQQTIAP